MLPDEVISEIRERVDMVTLVGDYVRLRKRGSNHVGLCPFHAEKTPSFSVSAVHKFFHCFGCKESGDAIGFLMRMEGVTFPQAARSLAERFGVALPAEDRSENAAERRERERRERLQALMEEACAFYEKQLREHPLAEVARAELSRRGIQAETSTRFRLGYAPHAWDALATHFERKKLDPREAEEVGLIAPRRSGNGHYDRFRGRLMFPIRDIGGHVVAFSGRILADPTPGAAEREAAAKDRGQQEPKYVNSPESPLYSKGSVLYGLHEARVELRRNGWALLCEGNFDLISLHQSGFGNAVAPMGTAFTAVQAKLLGRFGQRVTLLFDGDAAGAKAVQTAFPLLAQHNLRGLVAQLPKGEDPDSYVRGHGVEALRRLVSEAQGIVEYLIDVAARQGEASASDRAAAVQSLVPVLQTVSSPVEMELYVQRVAQRFDLPDTTAVRRQMRLAARPSSPASRETAHNSTLAATESYDKLPTLQQKELLALGALLDQPALLSTAYAGQLKGLLSPELRAVVDAAGAALQESGALDLAALFSALNDNRALSWVKERLTVQTCRSSDEAEQLLKTGIPLLEKARAERQQSLSREILEARRNGDDERAVRLTKQRDELKRSASVMLRRER